MAYYSESSSDSEEDMAGAVLNEDAGFLEHIIQPLEDADSTPKEEKLPDESSVMSARAYQLEMFEASMKENIIVAMDTGSGKTQVAILRIRAELERSSPEKIVWFLAPTVSLCAQQFSVIKTQIPLVQSRMICGADGVDTWTDKKTWDSVLLNIRIVVSTHQVLYDAASTHAFVSMESLALIVFDEAHNCNKKHAGSKLMKEVYWKAKRSGRPIPRILGLTASPVVKSDIKGLEELEATLDSICKSPTKHRDELLANSQRPSMFNILYRPSSTPEPKDFTVSMSSLHTAKRELNILEDPYVLSLKAESSVRSLRRLNDVLTNHKTYIQKQLKDFCRRSVEVYRDLGRWAADWYIYETIRLFLAGVSRTGANNDSYKDAEVVFLARLFQEIGATSPATLDQDSDLSEKMMKLIEVLLAYQGDARGIIFAKERATTVVLSHILATHPKLHNRFRIGKMVGTSFVPGVKRDFLDLVQKDDSSLEAFRSGTINILVATSVLEEGIDVPACNLVICVDRPSNLKSFIQRRGRARMRSSHLYLLMEREAVSTAQEWEKLEDEMKQHYEDELRELKKIEELENSEELAYPSFVVPSTGARLNIDDAKPHLYHFCSKLSSRKFVNFSPDFIYERITSEDALAGAPALIKATVLLPVCIPAHIRMINSSRAWSSEKNACKDAAFQAYKALYEAGLVNENLLPITNDVDRSMEIRPGLTEARELIDIWRIIHTSGQGKGLYRRPLRLLDQNGSTLCEFELVLPVPIPDILPLTMYWDHNTQFLLSMDSDLRMLDPGEDLYHKTSNATDHTSILMSLAYAHRSGWGIKEEECVVRIVSKSGPLSLNQIGSLPFAKREDDLETKYLVRDSSGAPYFYEELLPSKPPIHSVQKAYKGFGDDPEDIPILVVRKWPKKTGFFHPVPDRSSSSKPYSRVLPAVGTRVDSVPLVYAQFGQLLPCIIRYLELHLIAAELSDTLLKPLQIQVADISQIVTAICASNSGAPTNYERVEFLGDSILKLCTTVNCAASQLHWPEGLLSLLKDKMVSNSRLSRAAKESGLDQFIVRKPLMEKKWRPPYISDLEKEDHLESKREMPTKTLADVVESIIGICYIDGGLPKALQCISSFLPEGKFQSLDVARGILFQAAAPDMQLPEIFQPVEKLIGYTFRRKSVLLESLTHPSYNVLSTTASFDRLEFIGDAVLDYIIVKALFSIDAMENWKMHLLRTVCVNADILGLLIMELSITQKHGDVVSPADKSFVETDVTKALWTFMRYMSGALAEEQVHTSKRHAALREPLLEAIHRGSHYPWALLARLRAPKFYSDLFEAIVGAIWVDSGDFDQCAAFVERAGIMPLLRRLLDDDVHVLHPKEELGILANTETVKYLVETVETEEDGSKYACKVLVGKRMVAEVSGALYKEEAKTLGAEAAIRLMKEEGGKA